MRARPLGGEMPSKEEFAQSVGNANVRSKFDTDVATAVGPNTNDAVLFGRLRSDHDGNMTGLSLAGTVLARRYKILEMIDGDSFKRMFEKSSAGNRSSSRDANYHQYRQAPRSRSDRCNLGADRAAVTGS